MDVLLDAERPGRFKRGRDGAGRDRLHPAHARLPTVPAERAVCRAYAQRHRPDGLPGGLEASAKPVPSPHRSPWASLGDDEQPRCFIQRRPEDGMLGGLWEFPGGQGGAGRGPARRPAGARSTRKPAWRSRSAPRWRASHMPTRTSGSRCTRSRADRSAGTLTSESGEPQQWVTVDQLDDFAFPPRQPARPRADPGRRPGPAPVLTAAASTPLA